MTRSTTPRTRNEWMRLGSVLLILGALIGYWLYAEHREIGVLEGGRLQLHARVIDENLRRQLEGVNNALTGVIDDFLLPDRTGLGPTASGRLKALSDAIPGVRAMGAFDAQGTTVASSQEELIGRNLVSEREFFKVPRARPDPNVLYVSPPFKSVLGVHSINLVRAVIGPAGEFAGIVAATLEPEYFDVLLRSVLYAPDMRVALVHGSGKIFLVMPENERVVGMEVAAPASFFSRHRESGQVATLLTSTSVSTGDERLMASRTLDRAGLPMDKALSIHVSRNLSAMYLPWRSHALGYAVFYLLLVAAASLGLHLVQRRRWMMDRYSVAQRKERRENAERLELVLAGADLGLWDCHVPSGKLALNERWFMMLGYPAAEIEPQISSWKNLVHPEDMPSVKAVLESHLKGETPGYESEHRLRHKDGHWLWVLGRGKVVERDASGAPVRMVGTYMDISERKRAEDALRKSVAFSEMLLEAMPLPVFHKDAAGRYTGCNSAFTRFIGKTSNEIVGKTVFDVAQQCVAKTYWDKDLALLGGSFGTLAYEGTAAHADGTIHDVIFHKACITDDSGKPRGIVGAITDITERKQIQAKRDQLEAQLRQSQKMEALGTLAGGVAHDFNNIIAAIVGNAELARQDVGPGHAALDSLEEIRKASRRAKDLVQQILAFGRRQKASREVISLAPVVQESVRLLRTTLPAGVSLTAECEPDAPAVLADATQVEQVLLNLCGNAWHAIQTQSRPGAIQVLLQAHERHAVRDQAGGLAVAYGDMPPGRYACLAVRDNGSGMDKETLAHIFEPFFTTKPVDKGTGLGLAVVHGIVQEHGGSIEVQCVFGEGSTFRVYFPAAEAPERAPRTLPPEAALVHGQGNRVLFVDDDESIVLLMTRLLQRKGYRVSGFTDPLAALAAARADPAGFDLAVTDYNMPGMSGLDVARALRALRADLPIAVASGYISDELRAQAPVAGVNELVYKPNTVDELCEAVTRLAHGLTA